MTGSPYLHKKDQVSKIRFATATVPVDAFQTEVYLLEDKYGPGMRNAGYPSMWLAGFGPEVQRCNPKALNLDGRTLTLFFTKCV